MENYKFDGFILEVIPESKDTPMQISIESAASFTVELPKNGVFNFYPLDESGMNVVMFSMDNSSCTSPEISFVMSNDDLDRLKLVSVLPIVGLV